MQNASLRTKYQYKNEDGRDGFNEYFRHVTRFRPACLRWIDEVGGIPIIKACDVSHPNTPIIIKSKVEKSFKQYMQNAFEKDQGLETLRFAEHQPNQAKKAITQILQQRFKHQISENNVLLIYGSSTQWLDIIFGKVISESLHQDFANNNAVKKPVILAPAGSFKCGGYFPHANGGELQYISTTIDNKYKIDAELLASSIIHIEKDDRKKVVCFVLETPSALGQNYSPAELDEISEVLAKYPDVFWLQDNYNLGTEHDLKMNPSLSDCENIAYQGCTISSFRRDWGGAASYANVSALHSENTQFLKDISQQCSETYFYTHPPFSNLQRYVTNLIADEMKSAEFQISNQKYFCEQLNYFKIQVRLANQKLNEILNARDKQYIHTIDSQAGQFGFLFFAHDLMNKAGIHNGTELAEIMCVYPQCRIMPTLLSPMGIGKDPVGVRFNICMSNDPEKNQKIVDIMLQRIIDLVVAMDMNKLKYSMYATLIKQFYSEE